MPPSAPLTDIGQTDLYWGTWGQGLLTDWWETTADLIWPQSVITYGRMRHDPQLRAVLSAYLLPILRATWVIDPAGCRDEVVQHCADDLGVNVLGTEDEPGSGRRRGVIWQRHLKQALYHQLVYGHMPFERRYRVEGDRLRLDNLGPRMPWTLAQINLDSQAQIHHIVQTTQNEPIPGERLVWYVNDLEGANWAGISMLRPAFGAWLLKHETWRVHATSIRRFGMGVPFVEAPPGATAAMVSQAQQLASSMRAGDQAGVGLPQGFTPKLMGLTGSVPNALEFIQYLDRAMAKMALAGLIELGQTETGSRALGETFLDLFLLSLQSVADEAATVATSGHPGCPGILTDIVDVNWGEDEAVPRLVCTDVGENYQITAEAMWRLTQTGALSPDPALDNWIRKLWRIPERESAWEPTSRGLPSPNAPSGPVDLPGEDLPAPAEDKTPAPAPVEPPAPGKKGRAGVPVKRAGSPTAAVRPVRAAGTGLRRQLTPVEAASGFDPVLMKQTLNDQVQRLLTAYKAVARAQRIQLVDQVIEAVKAGKQEKLAALYVDTSDGATLIAQTMASMASTAAEAMITEADKQRVIIDRDKVKLRPMGHTAGARAALAGSYMAQQAGQKALQLVRAADPADLESEALTAGDAVDVTLAGLSDTPLKDQLNAAVTSAMNAGRMSVLEAAPESAGDALYVATEIMDDNTCASCEAEDGTEFDSLAEAEDAYPNGGYSDCDGGLRCRGTVIAIWGGASGE